MGAASAKMYARPADAQAAEIDNLALSTNIVLIPYSIFLEDRKYHNQSPTYCRGCGAALNMYSKLTPLEEYMKQLAEHETSEPLNDVEKAEQEKREQVGVYTKGKFIRDLKADELAWICEFCDVHNRLPGDTRLSETERELYMIKKAEAKVVKTEETKEDGQKAKDDISLIFCIDVSGSMGCTHEVVANGERKYVERMKLITDAVLRQLKEMKDTHPKRKVGVVLFGSAVTLKGDCNATEVTIATGLDQLDTILNESYTKGENLLTKSLEESYHKLELAIKNIEIGGGTALGPGLLGALALAGQGKAGSRIILCTDGLANVGVGVLEGHGQSAASRGFYDRVGDIAVEKGVSISIITVKGQQCQVDALGPLTDRTAGQILRIDPTNFDLAALAANNLIATDVRLKAIIHEGLAFKNDNNSNHPQGNESILERNIGSVSDKSEAYFEYCVKNVDELEKDKISLETLDSLPLQAQMSYTDLEGNQLVLVVSRRQMLTKDHKEAGEGIKAEILAGYIEKQSANLLLDGKVEEAKKKNEEWTKRMQQVASNNVGMSEESRKAMVEFQAQNQQLQAIIQQNAGQGAGMNAVEKDEITSKLYEMKQKQGKF